MMNVLWIKAAVDTAITKVTNLPEVVDLDQDLMNEEATVGIAETMKDVVIDVIADQDQTLERDAVIEMIGNSLK